MLVSRTMELVKDSSEGHGSLHSRMILYRNAILAGWRSGFLGLGPGGFSTFYAENPEDTDLINPHSLLMEILSQYGLVILVLFLGLLIYLIRRMIRMYHGYEQENLREWGRMGVIWIVAYLITSFASSTYLPNSFHWTLIALICLTFAAVVLGDRAGAWVGAVGFTAFALAFIGMTEGLRSFRDNCRSYLLGKLGTVYCGIMVAAWFLVFCVGLAKTM